MKILCLLDNVVKPGDQWLWNDLPSHNDQVDFIWVTTNDIFPKWGKLLTYYPIYLWLGIKTIIKSRKKSYDLIVAWEGKNGFGYALCRSILNISTPKFVILGYNQRGIITHFPALTRFALNSVDRIIVFTKWDAACLIEKLGIQPDKVTFTLHGYYDVGSATKNIQKPETPFIFSPGRSYRDYETLAKALWDIPVTAYINARPFNIKGIKFPPTVIVNDLVPIDQFYRMLAQAIFIVIPLRDVQFSAGDSVILQAMAAGKAIIATRSPSSETYVEDGVSGILVPPGDHFQMREAILYLLKNPSVCQQMGKVARQRYEKYHTPQVVAIERYKILKEVCYEENSH